MIGILAAASCPRGKCAENKPKPFIQVSGRDMTGTRFVRLGEFNRDRVAFYIDGLPAEGLEGDTLLVAILNQTSHLRHSEFDNVTRAGFCLMGACQDCWVQTEDGASLRACSTLLLEGMRITVKKQGREWLKAAS